MSSALGQLFRKVARIDAPGAVGAPGAEAWRAADEAAGNAWTIESEGVSRRFFFITGCSKSGTHWVQNLLGLHPRVCVKGEFHFEHLLTGFRAMLGRDFYAGASPAIRPIADVSYEAMVRRMMLGACDRPGATWIGDRSPRALAEVLPGAPIVNIRRDGRDVMVSWNFHHLRTKRPEGLSKDVRDSAARLAGDFQDNPEEYLRRGSGLLADERWFRTQARVWAGMIAAEMDGAPHLREAGTPVLQLVYERVHADTAGARKELYGFLGLDEAEAAPIGPESRTAAGFAEERPNALYRKGIVGDWHGYFTDRQRAWFKEEAGEALVRAGYEKDDQW